jgi:site-specific DNA recombinase
MAHAATLRDRKSGSSSASAIAVRSAVLYARVSSKDQEKEGYSIPAQERLLREYAPSHGLAITREFVDVETAKATGRQGFTAMLSYLTKHHASCRTILVEKTDRLYRNIKDWVTIDELDLEIHFVKENLVHSQESRSSEKFLHGIKVLMAKNYIDNLGEEASKGMLEKARSGTWPSSAPLGYQNAPGPDGKRTITLNPETAPHIIKLFLRYATGEESLDTLTQKAAADGLRRKGKPVNRATIHTILRNHFYVGAFTWRGVTYQGKHEPLITQALFDSVQRVLDRRHEGRARKITHDFTYTGILRCGHCTSSMVGELKKGRYVYYHCTGYRGNCHEPYVREESLHEEFGAVLRRIQLPNELLEWLTEELRLTRQDADRRHDDAISRLRAEHDRLQSRLDAMYVDKLDGKIPQAFYEEKAGEWRREQARLNAKINDLQTTDDAIDAEKTIDLLHLANQAADHYPTQPPSEQRALLRTVVHSATWKHGELAIAYNEPCGALSHSTRHDPSHGKKGVWPTRPGWPARRDSNARPTA